MSARPSAGSPAISGPPVAPAKSTKNEPLIIVQGGKEQSDPYRQELENIRRMKAQAQLTALSAPLGVKKVSESAAGKSATVVQEDDRRRETPGAQEGNSDPYGIRESSYDPAADKDADVGKDFLRIAQSASRHVSGTIHQHAKQSQAFLHLVRFLCVHYFIHIFQQNPKK